MSDREDLDSNDLEPGEIPATGVPELDAVIASVAALGDDRVEDHVAVLESAQVSLRRALDQPRTAN